MKRVWKKMAAVILMLTMVLAMSTIAWADTLKVDSTGTEPVVTNTASVEITNVPSDAANLSYDTYQVIYATYDKDSNSFEWHLTDWAESALVGTSGKLYTTDSDALKGIFALTGTNGRGISGESGGNSTTEQNTIVNTLAAYVANNSVMADSATWSTDSGISTASLAVGAYLVIPSAMDMSFLNMLVSVDVADTTTTASDEWVISSNGAILKGKPVGITKEVSDDISDTSNPGYGDDASVGIGDTVYYAITADVPQFPNDSTKYEFIITDTPQNVGIDSSSVEVYGVDSSNVKTKLTAYTASPDNSDSANYTVSVDASTGVLTVDFSNYYKKTFYNSTTGAYPYKSVYITYNAEVLSTALITTGNENTAEISYGSSYTSTVSSNTDEDKTKVYTYGTVLTKYDDSATPTALSNATFQVSDNGTALKFVEDSTSSATTKIYRVADSDDTGFTTDITTGTDGTITIIGLDADKAYTVKETKAPSGYSLNTNYITFTITAETDNSNGALTGNVDSVSSKEYLSDDTEVTSGNETWSAAATDGTQTSANAYMYITLKDTTISALPATGSIGIIVFTIAGVGIMVLALVLINSGKSKQKKA